MQGVTEISSHVVGHRRQDFGGSRCYLFVFAIDAHCQGISDLEKGQVNPR